MKFKLTLFLIASILCPGYGQESDSLQLVSPNELTITHVFDLRIARNQSSKILSSSGKKLNIKDPVLILNDDSLKVSSVKTHGKTSITFRRKSLTVTLQEIPYRHKEVSKKFVLVALQMDKNYWRNRLSFLLMRELDLFPLDNMLVETRINNQSQGVYLFVRKPDDFIKEIGSPLLVRRVFGGKFEIDYQKGEDGKNYWKQFQKGRTLPSRFKEKELADEIDTILDLNQYLKWLAFNFFIMNGDYADEVFFYFDPMVNRFRIIPWDYDDIFSFQPHEGWQQRKLTMNHDMLFSSEVYFDRIIDSDEYLYSRYLEVFEDLILNLSQSEIKRIFQQVYTELYPFYIQSDIIGQSEYDASGLTNLENFRHDLIIHYNFLISRYTTIQNILRATH